MKLTTKEERIVRKVSRHSWPTATLWCFIVLIACGLSSLGLSISGCMRLFRLADRGIQPETITVLSETWVSLGLASTALLSSIFIWGLRRYGLLIRKLGAIHEG